MAYINGNKTRAFFMNNASATFKLKVVKPTTTAAILGSAILDQAILA